MYLNACLILFAIISSALPVLADQCPGEKRQYVRSNAPGFEAYFIIQSSVAPHKTLFDKSLKGLIARDYVDNVLPNVVCYPRPYLSQYGTTELDHADCVDVKTKKRYKHDYRAPFASSLHIELYDKDGNLFNGSNWSSYSASSSSVNCSSGYRRDFTLYSLYWVGGTNNWEYEYTGNLMLKLEQYPITIVEKEGFKGF